MNSNDKFIWGPCLIHLCTLGSLLEGEKALVGCMDGWLGKGMNEEKCLKNIKWNLQLGAYVLPFPNSVPMEDLVNRPQYSFWGLKRLPHPIFEL